MLCCLIGMAATPILSQNTFIWQVFQALVNACQVLHFGQVIDAPGVRAHSKPTTHLDIKIDKVFLNPRWKDDGTHAVSTRPRIPAPTSPNHPPQTPDFVLTDFGLSICTMEQAHRPQDAAPVGVNYGDENPDQYMINSNTLIYYAPVSSDRSLCKYPWLTRHRSINSLLKTRLTN
jgi:hypothetical protein